MFVESHLSTVLELQEKSFALLRWVRGALRDGRLSFGIVHSNADSAIVAQEWIERHRAGIPADVRPNAEQTAMFARLFVSFLTTSYRLKANAIRKVSDCGCRCSCCSYLQAGPNIELRTPTKKDFATARELKQIYLRRLSAESGLEISSADIEAIFANASLRVSLSAATWASELIRRSEFASQGTAVLALWREYADQERSSKGKVTMTARTFIDAEKMVLAALQNESG